MAANQKCHNILLLLLTQYYYCASNKLSYSGKLLYKYIGPKLLKRDFIFTINIVLKRGIDTNERVYYFLS